jgi:voltage-gated potassium channel
MDIKHSENRKEKPNTEKEPLKPKTPKKSYIQEHLREHLQPLRYGTTVSYREPTHMDDIHITDEEEATPLDHQDDGDEEEEEEEEQAKYRIKRKKSLSKKKIKEGDPNKIRHRRRKDQVPGSTLHVPRDDDELSYQSHVSNRFGKTPRTPMSVSGRFRAFPPDLPNDAPNDPDNKDETVYEKHNKETMRRYLYMILEGGWSPWDQICNQIILFCVFLNIFCFIILTEKKLREIMPLYITVLILEGVTFGIFTLEYILRVYVSIERKSLRRVGRFWGRVKYMFRIMPFMDLLAILPYPVVHIVHAIHPEIGEGASSILRVFGILRLFKLEKYTHMGTALYEVIKYNREILWMTISLGFILLIMTSTLLYYSEKDVNPEYFPSIFGTMYTALMMLCGQGSPWDVGRNLTKMGYFFTAMTTAFSVAVFALPAGIIGSGFGVINEHMIKKRRKREMHNAGSESDTTDEDEEGDEDDEKSYLFFSETQISDEEKGKAKSVAQRDVTPVVENCPHCQKALLLSQNKILNAKTEREDVSINK